MSSFWDGVQPVDLIPGSPDELHDLAQRLRTLGTGLADAVRELSAINGGAWRGSAADAFRRVTSKQPRRFADAGDAFTTAANAVSTFADDLGTAQHTAQVAITMWYASERLTRSWVAESATHIAGTPLDPGAAGRSAAEEVLRRALTALERSSVRVIQSLAEAKKGAPSRPSIVDDLIARVASLPSVEYRVAVQVIEGVGDGFKGMVEGVWDAAKFAWSISPARMMIDPTGWAKTVSSDAKTIYKDGDYAVHHPVLFAKAVGENLINLKEWEHDPAKALGELVPTIALAVVTDGLGTEADAAADVAEDLTDMASGVSDASDSLDTLSAVASIMGDEQTADGAAVASSTLSDASEVLSEQAAALKGVGEAAEKIETAIKTVEHIDSAVDDVRDLDVATHSRS